MAKPVYALVNGVWTLVGSTTAHAHTVADVTGLQAAIDAKANIASPTFTGTLTADVVKITGGVPGAGKVLTSDADGDATWENTASGLPIGGTTGQVLAKASATDYDVTWGALAVNAIYSVDVGAVTADVPYVVTHNLGTFDIMTSVIEKTVVSGGQGAGDVVDVAVKATSEDTIELTFVDSAPANQYRVTIGANGSSIVEANDIRVQIGEPTSPRVGTVWLQP